MKPELFFSFGIRCSLYSDYIFWSLVDKLNQYPVLSFAICFVFLRFLPIFVDIYSLWEFKLLVSIIKIRYFSINGWD